MEDLENPQARAVLNIRGGIVGGVVGEAIRFGLKIPPTQAIAYPIHSGQGRQVGKPLLSLGVVAGEPGDRGIEADGRVGRGRGAQSGQDRRGGPGDTVG